MDDLHESSGPLRYSASEGKYWLVVDVDPGIVEVARALVPKTVRLNRTRYAPHITVIRNEVPPDLTAWKAHEGEMVTFQYDSFVYNDELYYWLNAYCQRLNDVRTELGLHPVSEWTRPPDMADCFHITIGNLK